MSGSAANTLVVLPGNVSFGSVTVGQTASTTVTLVNESSAPVAIAQLSVSGQTFFVNGQSSASATISAGSSQNNVSTTIPAGGSYKFQLSFKPVSAAAYSGEFTAMNSSAEQVAHGFLQGSGVEGTGAAPQLTVSSVDISFGGVSVNSTSAQPITLTSTGTAPVTVNAATLAGAGFTMSGATFPVTLNPNQAVTLQVQFDPAAAGAVTGQLTIDSNSSSSATTVVDLSGTGTSPGSTQQSSTPQLTINPSSLTFGNVTVNSPSTQPVTLTSTGTAPVTVNAATLTGAGFTMSGATFPVTLNPNQAVTLQVQFDPTAAGAATGQLTIDSNSSSNATTVVNLSGTGIPPGSAQPSSIPQLTINPSSLTFGNVTVSSASTQPVTLTSTGTAPVTVNAATLTGAGFTMSGATFPVTLNPNQAVTIEVQFNPIDTGTATGQLTIDSNSAAGGMEVINLSGVGTAAASPQLAVSAASLTFGNVTIGSTSTQPVTLTSKGTAPVTINAATLAGAGFTMPAAKFPATLNPNQSMTLEVQFDPTATGTATGQLTINSNSATTGTMVVNLSGMGTAASSPQLAVSDASLTFGNVTVGSTSTQPVTLTSTGTAPITINAATLSGAGFTMPAAKFPATLNPNQSMTLEVQFNPTAAGTATGQLTINSNSATSSTMVVNLGGTGTAASSPQLAVSVASLTFGDVTVGSTSTQPVTLTSTGTAPVTINGATLVGAGFTMSGSAFPVTLNPNQAVTLEIQFDPSATGPATGQFTINSNSATRSTVVVNLSGAGTAASSPQLTVSAASLTFGNVTVNSASTLPLTLTSTGTAPVTINTATLAGAGFTMSGATFPVTLNPDQTVALQIQFDPSAAGATAGQLTINSNSATNSSVVVNLSGTGAATSSPQLTVSAASLAFGNVTVNSTSTQTLTLTSTGSEAVTINAATLAGTGFTMSGSSFPVTLDPGLAVTLQIQFEPTATGAATGQLTIRSDSATGGTTVVNLSGTGAAAATSQLTISPTSLSFGNITVNSASTQTVTLSSTGSKAVTVNSATLAGTAFTMSGASFPVTLNPGLALTVEIQFEPTAAGAATGQLTVQSDSATGGTTVVTLSGTGQGAVTHEVDLSWDAPSSSPVPIVGYNIYRSPSGSSTYQLLNSSVDAQTTYGDSSVQSGLAYDYIVESVSSSGVDSVPSNTFTATIP